MQPAKIPFISNHVKMGEYVRVSWFDKAFRCPFTHLLVQVQRLQLKKKLQFLSLMTAQALMGPSPGPHSH